MMSKKNIFTLVLASVAGGLFLISCKNDQKNSDKKVITEKIKKVIKSKAIELANDGMQVITLAEKNSYPGINSFNTDYEKDMTEIMAFYAQINAKFPENFSVDTRYFKQQ